MEAIKKVHVNVVSLSIVEIVGDNTHNGGAAVGVITNSAKRNDIEFSIC
jgi:hypothetical protein